MEWDPAQRTPKENYHFLTSAVAPRPIAWVTTLDLATGVVNAAPFSWFNAVCADPPTVMLSIARRADGSPKDTLRNARATGEFVVNAAVRPLLEPLVQSSADYPPNVSEVAELGLRTAPSLAVRPPRLADAPWHLECRLRQDIPLGHVQKVSLLLGVVVHVHADDAVLDERGNVDPAKAVLLARMGGSDYADTERHFAVRRPSQADVLRRE